MFPGEGRISLSFHFFWAVLESGDHRLLVCCDQRLLPDSPLQLHRPFPSSGRGLPAFLEKILATESILISSSALPRRFLNHHTLPLSQLDNTRHRDRMHFSPDPARWTAHVFANNITCPATTPRSPTTRCLSTPRALPNSYLKEPIAVPSRELCCNLDNVHINRGDEWMVHRVDVRWWRLNLLRKAVHQRLPLLPLPTLLLPTINLRWPCNSELLTHNSRIVPQENVKLWRNTFSRKTFLLCQDLVRALTNEFLCF